MARNWKSSDVTYLKRYGSNKTVADLAERFETDEAAVAEKLRELSITPKGGWGDAGRVDPAVEHYESGLEALYGGKRDKARKLFEKVVEESDQRELTARARRLLAVCDGPAEAGEEAADPYLQAVYLKNRGEYDEALAICREKKRAEKEGHFAYLAASIHAAQERTDEAEEALLRAIELDPKHRIYAYHDPDFAAFRKSHQELFEVA